MTNYEANNYKDTALEGC